MELGNNCQQLSCASVLMSLSMLSCPGKTEELRCRKWF